MRTRAGSIPSRAATAVRTASAAFNDAEIADTGGCFGIRLRDADDSAATGDVDDVLTVGVAQLHLEPRCQHRRVDHPARRAAETRVAPLSGGHADNFDLSGRD